jgi:hypothetical protein
LQLVLSLSPADIAHRQGLAAQSAALPEAKRFSAQQGRCCHCSQAPNPSFPESLTEGSPGRVRPILCVIALAHLLFIVRLVLLSTTVWAVGPLASVSICARATCTIISFRYERSKLDLSSVSMRSCLAADEGLSSPRRVACNA